VSPRQISRRSVEPLVRYGDFSIFQDGAAALDLQNGNFRGGKGQRGQTASVGQTSHRSVKPLLRYGEFSIFPRWRPSAILDL